MESNRKESFRLIQNVVFIIYSKDGLEHFVGGAGSMTDTLGKTKSAATLNWYGAKYSAFIAVNAKEESLQVQFFDTSLSRVYSYTLDNPFVYELPAKTEVSYRPITFIYLYKSLLSENIGCTCT